MTDLKGNIPSEIVWKTKHQSCTEKGGVGGGRESNSLPFAFPFAHSLNLDPSVGYGTP